MSEDQPEHESKPVIKEKEKPIWIRPARNPRSQRPSLTREQIVRAAIQLANAEGLEALSMRRLAKELGAGAMSLYWHVPNKEDLLDLMLDTAFGEVDLPEQPSANWRADLRLFARHMLSVLRRYRWLPALISSRPLPSPNRVRHIERFLSELVGLGIDFTTIGGILSTVEAYVDGVAQREAAPEAIRRRTGMTEAEWRAAFAAYMEQILSSGQYPTLARLIARNAEVSADATFEFGLECVLDGIAAHIAAVRRDGRSDTSRATFSAQE
jgi:AcrR family transcriptional regulator